MAEKTYEDTCYNYFDYVLARCLEASDQAR